ncbi:hypothetical protein QCA50_011499 [Cerrena zonata]|uniref:Uncharacterized protein n=1 Tax=Cerrena zonata TaxID=2478898 RepID=A0AAW0FW53_9APHY
MDDLQQCLITKLELLKYNNDHEHEIVLAHIEYCGDANPQRQYFRLERDSDPASLPRRIRSLPGADDNEAQTTGDTRSSEARNDWIIRHADVRVTKKPVSDLKLKGQSHLCYTVSFSGPDYPTILDLSSAARMLSDVAPHYIAFDHMCYWFSHNLCRVLSLGRRYSIKVDAQDAGHWKGVPVINGFGQLMLAAFMPAASDAPDVEEARHNTIVVDDGSSLESIPPIFSKGCFTHSEQIIEMWKRYRGVFEQMVDDVQGWDVREQDKDGGLEIEMIRRETAEFKLETQFMRMEMQEVHLHEQIASLMARWQANPNPNSVELEELVKTGTMLIQRITELKADLAETRYQLTRAKLAIEPLLRRQKEAWRY